MTNLRIFKWQKIGQIEKTFFFFPFFLILKYFFFGCFMHVINKRFCFFMFYSFLSWTWRRWRANICQRKSEKVWSVFIFFHRYNRFVHAMYTKPLKINTCEKKCLNRDIFALQVAELSDNNVKHANLLFCREFSIQAWRF